tara:strand:- start:234 stop:425 length:192 start_codon:yes stop_codon:yes gene_type:complete
MDSFKDINLGSNLLSIAIAGGFIAFLILILRTFIIAINSFLQKVTLNKTKDNEINKQSKSEGF